MSLTLAQKKKFAKDLIKSVTDKVVAATDAMPEDWDGIEIRAYITREFDNAKEHHALRGNTARGRAFNAELTSNRKL